jgi:hypothetical protein
MKDLIINGLAVIGAVSCLIWLVKAIKALLTKAEIVPDEVAVPSVQPSSEHIAAVTAAVYAIVGPHRIVSIETVEPANDDIAAIAAAVYAVVGPHRIVAIDAEEPANDDIAAVTAAIYAVVRSPHRIVYIEKPNEASPWAVEGRRMHQTS